MSQSTLDSALAQIEKTPNVKVLVFTGGEPTLKGVKLLNAIERGSKMGLVTRLVTNSWWATTQEKANECVNKLKNAGLTEINTSFDDYHAKFVSIGNICRFTKAALDNHLAVAIATVVDSYSKIDSDFVKVKIGEYLGMTTDELMTKVVFMEDLPSLNGRGRKLGLDSGRVPIRNDLRKESGCTSIIEDISIHPNGDVKVCCGHAMIESQDLTAGNLNSDSFKNILYKAQRNLGYWLIHSVGPTKLLTDIGVEGDYTNICHACGELLTNHHEDFVTYIRENKGNLIMNEVLLGDTIRRELRKVKIIEKPSKKTQQNTSSGET
jgi:MoaA/NifB/PqqE/SkfB family radical SAM enzyme